MNNQSLSTIKHLIIALIICIIGIIACFVPYAISASNNASNSNTTSHATAYSNTPTGQNASSFATNDLSTMANEYLGAMATVKIVKNTTNKQVSMGSGVAVADGGYLVTNFHVISNVVAYENTYHVVLEMLYNNELVDDVNAEVLWYNSHLDLAVLKSEQNFQTYVQYEDRWIEPTTPLKIAETVWTLGTPYEEELFGTFSQGTISSCYKRVGITEVLDTNFIHNYLIQHNACISSGNSGGGLFDTNGKLIGLNTCGYASSSTATATNLFFAIPIYPLTLVLDKIITGDINGTPYTTPLLGVKNCYDKEYINVDSTCKFNQNGVYIDAVPNTSNAYKEGIRSGDIIIGLGPSNCTGENDEKYIEVNTKYDFLYGMLHFNKGDKILVFLKNGLQSHNMEVELT